MNKEAASMSNLPVEVLEDILQEIVAQNIHELCVPPPGTRNRQLWNSLKVLPQVSRRFRVVSMRVFATAFYGDSSYSKRPQSLQEEARTMNAFARASPTMYTPRSQETNNITLTLLGQTYSAGILKIYWDVVVMHQMAQDTIRIGWRNNDRWTTAFLKLQQFLGDPKKESYAQRKPKGLIQYALKHYETYKLVYNSVCTFWTVRKLLQIELDGKREVHRIIGALRRLESHKEIYHIALHVSRELMKTAIEETEFLEMLERIHVNPAFGEAGRLAEDIRKDWIRRVGQPTSKGGAPPAGSSKPM